MSKEIPVCLVGVLEKITTAKIMRIFLMMLIGINRVLNFELALLRYPWKSIHKLEGLFFSSFTSPKAHATQILTKYPT